MDDAPSDCREVLARLYQYIDGEIAAVDCASIELHFRDCEDCMHHADFEREFKAIIKRKCTDVAPEDIIARLRARLRETPSS